MLSRIRILTEYLIETHLRSYFLLDCFRCSVRFVFVRGDGKSMFGRPMKKYWIEQGAVRVAWHSHAALFQYSGNLNLTIRFLTCFTKGWFALKPVFGGFHLFWNFSKLLIVVNRERNFEDLKSNNHQHSNFLILNCSQFGADSNSSTFIFRNLNP